MPPRHSESLTSVHLQCLGLLLAHILKPVCGIPFHLEEKGDINIGNKSIVAASVDLGPTYNQLS